MFSSTIWICIAVAGIISLINAWALHLNNIDAVSESKSTVIGSWLLLSSSISFSVSYIPHDEGYMFPLLTFLLGSTAIMFLLMTSWRRYIAPVQYIFIGLIIALLSNLVPITICWMIAGPVIMLFMQNISIRNIGSLVTGAFFGIWMTFVWKFITDSEQAAMSVLDLYDNILHFSFPSLDLAFDWTIWLYIIAFVFIKIIYIIWGITYSVGHNLQTKGVDSMISVIGICLMLLLIFNFSNAYLYIPLLSVMLSLHISVHMTNSRTPINETICWSVIMILLILSLLPYIISYDYSGTNRWLQEHSIL